MGNSISIAASVACAGCLLFVGCQQTGANPHEAPEPPPSILGSPDQTRWEYLAAKYDTDGSGSITTTEYDRSEERFAGFDRDGNGVLEPGDFETREGRMQIDSPERRRRISSMILARYFQADEDAEKLTRDETIASFAVFDADGDGRLTREEFETEATARGATPNNRMDRFTILVETVSEEGAEHFDLAQLTACFDSLDEDGRGFLEGPRRRSRGDRSSGGGEPEVDDAPNAAGKLAPDFELERLHAKPGERPVLLSSFAGKKPVALIFGSYT